MPNDLRLLRIGFGQGLFTREDVRNWVDHQVEARDELAPELLELTTIAHMRDDEVVKLLVALESPTAPAELARLEVCVLATRYLKGSVSVGNCIAQLYSLVCWTDGFTEQERSAIYMLESAVDLVCYGTYGTVEDVQAELEEFLAAYELPPSVESTWARSLALTFSRVSGTRAKTCPSIPYRQDFHARRRKGPSRAYHRRGPGAV